MRSPGVITSLALVAGAGAIAFGSAGLASASPAVLASGAPGGNNGTIKIDTTPLLAPSQHDEANHPHVACSLALSFFGFDAGKDSALVSFTAQPPSGTFTPVSATESATAPTAIPFTGHGPGNSLDLSLPYKLDVTGLTANPKQGYHIKVSVEVTFSHGSDDKSKVFWYKPCPPGSGSGGSSQDTTTTTVAATTTTLPPVKGKKGPAPFTGSTPGLSAGQSQLSAGQSQLSAGQSQVAGLTPQVASGQAAQAASAAIPTGAATDLGHFEPAGWFGGSSAPWILIIVAGALLMGTGTVGLRNRRT